MDEPNARPSSSLPVVRQSTDGTRFLAERLKEVPMRPSPLALPPMEPTEWCLA